MTTPFTNRIRSAQSAAIVLLFLVVMVFAPLAFIQRVEHSHPITLNSQQLAHSHNDQKLDNGRSHYHHDRGHHHHDHSHDHHATPESAEVDHETRSSRLTNKSEISSSSRHQHFNLFGLSFTIQLDTRFSGAGLEDNQSIELGLFVALVLDVRSPMPPTDATFDSCLIWQPVLACDSLEDGCEADRPDTPPPESTFC